MVGWAILSLMSVRGCASLRAVHCNLIICNDHHTVYVLFSTKNYTHTYIH